VKDDGAGIGRQYFEDLIVGQVFNIEFTRARGEKTAGKASVATKLFQGIRIDVKHLLPFDESGQTIRNVQNVFELAAILSKSAPASGRPTPRYDGLSPMERRILGSRSAAKKEPNRLFSKWQSHN
jgi:hypothetical protein